MKNRLPAHSKDNFTRFNLIYSMIMLDKIKFYYEILNFEEVCFLQHHYLFILKFFKWERITADSKPSLSQFLTRFSTHCPFPIVFKNSLTHVNALMIFRQFYNCLYQLHKILLIFNILSIWQMTPNIIFGHTLILGY